MPLDHARATGATFLTANALAATRARLAAKETEQSVNHQWLWADLLSRPALAFNLFGDLAANVGLADRFVHALWPDTPGTVTNVRFLHSPGRLDREFLGNLVDLDAVFELDLGDGALAVLAVATPYADWNHTQPPKPQRLPRYVEVSERSGVFAPGWLDPVNGTTLIHVWLEHMLVHSMLQHPSGRWRWGRYVVVHPAANADFSTVCAEYKALMADDSSFTSMTLEALLDAGQLPAATTQAVRERYLLDA